MDLQGRVKFPTGGKVRKRNAQNRCNSDTDSKVWMEEDTLIAFSYPECIHSGYFLRGDCYEEKTGCKKDGTTRNAGCRCIYAGSADPHSGGVVFEL